MNARSRARAAAGWRETLEPGIYRNHRVACASARDRRPGRRCACRLQVAVPGAAASRLVTMPDETTITEARNERRRLLAAGRPTQPGPAEARPLTVHELAVAYFRARSPMLAPSTLHGRDEAYRLRVAPHLRDVPIDTLNRPRVEAWLGTLLAAGSSVHAARKALDALRVMLTFAVRGDLLDRNPALGIQIPEPPVDPDAPPPVERVLGPAELAALLDACETPRERVIIRLAAESGLRAGEVRGLRWLDVDMPARRVTVRRAVWRDIVKMPKGKRPRRIAITPALAEALADLYELEVLERGRDGRGYVLTGRDGVSPIGTDTPLEVAQQVQLRAGLVVERTPAPTRHGKPRNPKPEPRVTYHELRHTAATVMLTNGTSATVVARQLGHADSRITTQVYEHLLHDGLLDEALTAFDRLPEVAGRVAGPIVTVRGEAANPLQ